MNVSPSQVLRAVEAFDARYGQMELVLWRLSTEARRCLLHGERPEVAEALVWTIRSWWGLQGVSRADGQAMARALRASHWEPGWFVPTERFEREDWRAAAERVRELVSRTKEMGGRRREWSLSSKVLHWLMPWRVPAYDSFVREALGVRSEDPETAYQEVAHQVFRLAVELVPLGRWWLGQVPPASPLRALDKYLWMLGGGGSSAAVQVRDPQAVLRELGIPCEVVEAEQVPDPRVSHADRSRPGGREP